MIAVITFGRSASGVRAVSTPMIGPFTSGVNSVAVKSATTTSHAFDVAGNRLTEIWLSQGFRALLEEIAHEDPDWLGVQFEAARRIHTDPEFQELVAAAEAELVAAAEAELVAHQQERLERLREQGVRKDIPLQATAVFLSLIANGLALRRTMGDPMPDLDALAELVDRGVAKRGSRKGHATWKQTATPRTRPTPRSRRRSSAG
jgi:hypothetical protein